MPRTSGRSGNVFVEPILPNPSARNVPRCFGLMPIRERTSVILYCMSRNLGDFVLAALALAVRVEHALRRHFLGRLAAQAGDIVGTPPVTPALPRRAHLVDRVA